jgi:hypothetical protein
LASFGLAAFRANFGHGLVDDALDLVGISASVARPDVLDGALKHAPADSVLDELRKVSRSPFFMPWEPRKVRRIRSVFSDTLMLQRTPLSMWHLDA